MSRNTISATARNTLMVWTAGLAASVAAWAAPQVTTTTTRAPAAQVRSTCVGCTDSVLMHRDELFRKLKALRREFEQPISVAERELLSRELTAVIMELQAIPSASASAAPRARGGALLRSPDRVVVSVGPAEKWGYVGVTFDGMSVEDRRLGTIRWFAYPRIVTVDPESPAARAGLLRGDTLLAFNGMDVVDREFMLSRLLVPKERLSMRVRRDGDDKEFRVIVGEPPGYVVRRISPDGFGPARLGVVAPPGVAQVAPPPPAAWPAQPPVAAAPRARSTFTGSVYFFNNPVAGATIEPLNDGLAALTGATEGVFVVRVTPQSEAHRSGIRSGDVIVSTRDGQRIRDTRDLTLLIAEGNRGEGLPLVILRERKRQELILRW